MRIFATSDTHNDGVILRKLKDFITEEKFDYVIHCGDIGGKDKNDRTLLEFGSYQYDHYMYLRQQFPHMLYILGNDDWFEVNPLDKKHIQTNAFDNKEFGIPTEFLAFEWVKITPFTTNREANENKIWYEVNKLRTDQSSIIIAHDPPYDCQDMTLRGEKVGSMSIRKYIEEAQPKLWLCGHIHEDFGVKAIGRTGVFNCACDPGRHILRGWIIDTDTLEYEKVII